MRLAPPWLTSYRRRDVRPDALAGLTVWSIVVPQAVAYAQIAGLPPQAALFERTALVLTGGPSLYQAKRERHDNIHCFPSSVDAAHC